MRQKISAFGHKFTRNSTRTMFFDKNMSYTIEDNEGVPFGFFKYKNDRDIALTKFTKFGMAGERSLDGGR